MEKKMGSLKMSESLKYFRQKKGQWIWVYDMETNRRKKIELQVLLNRVNHTLRHENQTYFALEKQRDKFREECRS